MEGGKWGGETLVQEIKQWEQKLIQKKKKFDFFEFIP